MNEEDPTKCPPSHRWSSCHPPTSDGSVCLATDKCPVCPVTFRSLPAITRMSSDEVQMKVSYQCPTSVLLLSDYLPIVPITLLLVTYQHYICVTNWNVSDQYPTKLVGSEKSTFRPASGQPPGSVEGGHNAWYHRRDLAIKLKLMLWFQNSPLSTMMILNFDSGVLIHWGWVTHICVANVTTIASDNGLSPGRRQAIIWTNVGILLIGPLWTNFSGMLIKISIFSFKKMCLRVSSAKWRPFCLGLNVLMDMCNRKLIRLHCKK